MNVGAWEEGGKGRRCSGSVRNAYAGGSGAQEGDRWGGPWLPSAEDIAADSSVSTPETGGEHPHTQAWERGGGS